MEQGREIKITAVKKRKGSPAGYEIFEGDRSLGIVTEDLLVRFSILPGKTVGAEEPEIWRQENRKSEARRLAVRWLGRRAKTSAELRRKLSDEGYERDLVEEIVDECTDKGYLNDAEYARQYAEHRMERQKKGRLRVMAELQQKGIPDDVIRQALSRFGEEEETERAWEAGMKKWNGMPDVSRQEARAKSRPLFAAQGIQPVGGSQSGGALDSGITRQHGIFFRIINAVNQ